MTRVAMKKGAQVLSLKTPTMTRNSPMKPLVPGRPTEAMVKIMKAEGIARHVVHEAASSG
jgi:hypothetical protein